MKLEEVNSFDALFNWIKEQAERQDKKIEKYIEIHGKEYGIDAVTPSRKSN